MLFTSSNGLTLEYRRVPTNLAAQLMRQYPDPQPPRQRVDIGGGVFQEEENFADPDYIQATKDHTSQMEERLRSLIIKRGVINKLSTEQLEEVRELREWWKQEYDGKELPGSNLEVYVNYIVLQSPEDTKRLLEEVTAVSQPTPKSDSTNNS